MMKLLLKYKFMYLKFFGSICKKKLRKFGINKIKVIIV